MASPQKENGYTAIANEILEKLAKTRLNGESRRIVDVIFRKTYGFNKKKDAIALSQFVDATNLKKSAVCRSLKRLINMNIIIKIDNGITTIYGFNKDFDTWKELTKLLTLTKPLISVNKIVNKGGHNSVTYKRNNTKETITKEMCRFAPPTQEEVKNYCLERKNNVDPERWYNFYSAKGWFIGKNKMKDWKAAVRTWEKGENKPKTLREQMQ